VIQTAPRAGLTSGSRRTRRTGWNRSCRGCVWLPAARLLFATRSIENQRGRRILGFGIPRRANARPASARRTTESTRDSDDRRLRPLCHAAEPRAREIRPHGGNALVANRRLTTVAVGSLR